MIGVPARLFAPSDARSPELALKRTALETALNGMGRTLVAYSGGVDSSFLLVEAHRVLGDGVVGVIARSASLPEAELSAALDLAAGLRIPVRIADTHEILRSAYRANAGDRCYHCKAELFERLEAMAAEEGFSSLAYGAVTDDLGEVRPGMRAAAEFEVRAPLVESGLSKLEVRVLARAIGLPVWDKPQSACLASRIPVGEEVTEAKLRQVERAEEWIRERFGVQILRVRHHGAVARIEVAPREVGRMLEPATLAELAEGLRPMGFERVEVDERGYRRPDPMPVLEREEGHGDSR